MDGWAQPGPEEAEVGAEVDGGDAYGVHPVVDSLVLGMASVLVPADDGRHRAAYGGPGPHDESPERRPVGTGNLFHGGAATGPAHKGVDVVGGDGPRQQATAHLDGA